MRNSKIASKTNKKVLPWVMAILVMVMIQINTAPFASAAPGTTGAATTPDPGKVGVTAGTGALLVAGTNTPFIPLGFTSVGVLYPTMYDQTMCTQTGNRPSSTQGMALQQAQQNMTTMLSQELSAMKNDWSVNTVRFQISQGALQFEYAETQARGSIGVLTPYTDMVWKVIAAARAADLVVIAVLQTETYSCTPLRPDQQFQKLPDQLTEEAWTQLLTNSALINDKGVILEIFNEPSTEVECPNDAGSPYNWMNWATGCQPATGTDEGMITVGKYVRSIASDNVLLFDADNYAGGFAGFSVPADIPKKSAFTVHPFHYDINDSVSASESDWDMRFGNFQANSNTILATAWNESLQCPPEGMNREAITSDLVQTYLPNRSIGLLAFAWDAPPTDAGYLVDPNTFAPINSNQKCSDVTGASLIQLQFTLESVQFTQPPGGN